MNTVKIPKSVECYKDECEAILSWIKPDKWLSQDEFDRLSFKWRTAPRKVTIRNYEGGTMVPPMNGDLNLAIVHEFQREGLIETRMENEKIEYRIAAHVPKRP